MLKRILLSTKEVDEEYVSRHIILDNEKGCWRVEKPQVIVSHKTSDKDRAAKKVYDESHLL
jgi:hypothetical protein